MEKKRGVGVNEVRGFGWWDEVGWGGWGKEMNGWKESGGEGEKRGKMGREEKREDGEKG